MPSDEDMREFMRGGIGIQTGTPYNEAGRIVAEQHQEAITNPGRVGSRGGSGSWVSSHREDTFAGFLALVAMGAVIWFLYEAKIGLDWYYGAGIALIVGFICNRFFKRFEGLTRILRILTGVCLVVGVAYLFLADLFY